MTQITVSQYVDIDVDLDDIDTDDLALELIKRANYTAALDKALKKAHTNDSRCEDEDDDQIKALVDAFRMRKPVESIIASIAFNKYGFVC